MPNRLRLNELDVSCTIIFNHFFVIMGSPLHTFWTQTKIICGAPSKHWIDWLLFLGYIFLFRHWLNSPSYWLNKNVYVHLWVFYSTCRHTHTPLWLLPTKAHTDLPCPSSFCFSLSLYLFWWLFDYPLSKLAMNGKWGKLSFRTKYFLKKIKKQHIH